MTRVGLVTCAAFPGMEDDDQPLIPALAAVGIDAVPCVWNDPAVDWDRFALNVVRNPWDYTDQVDDFVAWARRTPRLANPGEILAWNIDKRYLAEIAAAGVPTIPTTYVAPGDPLPDAADLGGELVVKPTVSAGSRDTLRLADPDAVAAHIGHIHSLGKTAMVQPYLAAVDEVGETATIWFHGTYSHAARKGPLLPLGRSLVDGLYAPELMTPRTATPEELEVGAAALAAVPGDPSRLLYARVDLIPDAAGTPTVLEIEITEPTLFLEIGGAYERFADAVAAATAAGR